MLKQSFIADANIHARARNLKKLISFFLHTLIHFINDDILFFFFFQLHCNYTIANTAYINILKNISRSDNHVNLITRSDDIRDLSDFHSDDT